MGGVEVEGSSGGADNDPGTPQGQISSLLQDLAAVTREKRRVYAALLPKPCTAALAVQTIWSSA
eukprot:11289877-Prorocentrum_lima.AAC.1